MNVIIFVAVLLTISVNCEEIDQEKLAISYLNNVENEYERKTNILNVASWAYESNITDESLNKKSEIETEYAKFSKEVGLKLLEFNYQDFKDGDLKRKIKKFTDLGDALLPEEKFKNLSGCINEMSANYAKTKVASFEDPSVNLELEPDLVEIFAKSRDPEKLKYYWTQWYDKMGEANRDIFFEYVKLRNESAHLNSEYFK
jgi:peptidyl-dipeptidase A